MKYETWKVQSHPTPNNKLLVCDKCQEANWWIDYPGISYCRIGHGRLREGTAKEYLEATNNLKEVIDTCKP